MFKFPNLSLVLAVIMVVACGAYVKGRYDEAHKQNLVQVKITKQLHEAEKARLEAEKGLIDLREKLNAEAYADPDADRLSFGTSSLQRLNQVE